MIESIGPYAHLPVLVALGLFTTSIESRLARWIIAIVACFFVAVLQTLVARRG